MLIRFRGPDDLHVATAHEAILRTRQHSVHAARKLQLRIVPGTKGTASGIMSELRSEHPFR